ncbi:glycosyltransferase [Undibacterium sp. Jales W-56]|uniref:glycosyltransferase family 2 protein n=1 Tax=Undibacterium sp. Jales W-56 TaxID=2897325 RepID=UPI0021D322B7|nr:glycosyltransferase family 2 protein [Undibacterium sp. Jales W-56]MCU6433261.1 glycosyltransferase [Undibacterium sp. Jales W-56]
MLDISICICTFRRPVLLRVLLDAIHQQEADHLTIQVVVVDNDPAQSASQVLSEARSQFGDRLTPVALAESNISLARNAAVHAALGEWIVFIDDDERPEPGWLSSLIKTQQKHTADVVFAPVLAEYADGVAEWLKQGGYFDRRRLVTGTTVTQTDARSGNVLVRRTALMRLCDASASPPHNGPFDAAYGKTGGEDSILFRQLEAAGARMVWCDEAPVYEWIPLERAQAKWLLQRSYRTGQLFMRTELAMQQGGARIIRAAYLASRAAMQLLVAAVLAIVLLAVKPLQSFKWLRILASQAGKLSYLFGSLSQAYGSAS